jgi:hypothetical protein
MNYFDHILLFISPALWEKYNAWMLKRLDKRIDEIRRARWS